MDDDEKALADLPNLADRMVYHTKRLRLVQYASGAEGVAAYKAKHPEAKSIQTRATTIAFQPKPEGYSDFLCELVDGWFLSDVALAETNRADVERLNRAMHPRRFNPDNHFSKPVSANLLAKLADVFAKHGCHLDTRKPLSMGKVRAAVKAAKGRASASRPFGSIGHISEGQLMIADERFAIQKNGNRECIRPTINGSKRRLYLDELEWLLSLYSSMEHRIGDRDYLPQTGPEADPLADTLPENGTNHTTLLEERDYSPLGELAALPAVPPSLSDRIAALKAGEARSSIDFDDGPDPLAT
jgi:hypothetical protein